MHEVEFGSACLEFHGSTLILQSLSASFEVWFREFKLEGFKGAGLWDLVFWGSPPAPPSPLTSHNSRDFRFGEGLVTNLYIYVTYMCGSNDIGILTPLDAFKHSR